jgi:hypothetical protein
MRSDCSAPTPPAAPLVADTVGTARQRYLHPTVEPVVAAIARGIAVLDIHQGRWGLCHVSVAADASPLQITTAENIISDGFIPSVFQAMTRGRPLLLTDRARRHCDESSVLEAMMFDPTAFLAHCTLWMDILQEMAWQEYDRQMQDAAHSPSSGPAHHDLPLMAWPPCRRPEAWMSAQNPSHSVERELRRISTGCAGLLNLWISIETERLPGIQRHPCRPTE